jgi:hypothetical protein
MQSKYIYAEIPEYASLFRFVFFAFSVTLFASRFASLSLISLPGAKLSETHPWVFLPFPRARTVAGIIERFSASTVVWCGVVWCGEKGRIRRAAKRVQYGKHCAALQSVKQRAKQGLERNANTKQSARGANWSAIQSQSKVRNKTQFKAH